MLLKKALEYIYLYIAMKTIAAVLVTSLLLPTMWFAVGIDQWSAASLNFAFEVVFISLSIGIGLAAFLIQKRWQFFLPSFASVVFLGILPFLDITPVKPALRSLREIKPGMTETQVIQVLDRNFPAHGRFTRPDFGFIRNDVLSFVLDRTDHRYDAAVVQITFSKGKCITAEFLAD